MCVPAATMMGVGGLCRSLPLSIVNPRLWLQFIAQHRIARYANRINVVCDGNQ